MKNYTVNSSILSALEACSFFSKGNGIESFPYSQVKECAIGNKYIYKLSGVEAHIINQIHESLISTLLEKLPVNNSATAYLKNKSYLDFLEPHRNNYYFLRIDLKISSISSQMKWLEILYVRMCRKIRSWKDVLSLALMRSLNY